MARPLQVYLDSSDFSKIGDAMAGMGADSDLVLAKRLRELSTSGEVQFRFSSIHLLEMAAVRMQDVAASKRRAAALQFICGKHALEPWERLPVIDAIAHLSGDTALPPRERLTSHARNDDGHWFPSVEGALDEVRADTQGWLNDPLATVQAHDPTFIVSRATRRKAERKAKSGRAQREILRDMRAHWPERMAKFRRLFPISKANEGLWLSFLTERATAGQVAQALRDDLADLDLAMEWLAPSGGTGAEQPTWFRSAGEQFAQKYDELRGEAEYKRQEMEPRIGRANLERSWRESRLGRADLAQQGLVDVVKKRIVAENGAVERAGLQIRQVVKAVDEQGVSILPSQVTLSAVFAHNLRKNLSPFENRRKIQNVKSDVGDMFHAMYMPYVDIIRVDGFADQYLGSIASEWKTVVVKDRGALLSAIESALSSRGA